MRGSRPDGGKQPLVRGESSFQERRDVILDLRVAGHLLHRDQPDALLVGGVEGEVDRVVLRQKRAEREHDHVDEPAFGGRLDLLGLEAVMSGKADELDLAGFLDRLDGFFHLLALGPVDLFR